jgi:hypothetical protein
MPSIASSTLKSSNNCKYHAHKCPAITSTLTQSVKTNLLTAPASPVFLIFYYSGIYTRVLLAQLTPNIKKLHQFVREPGEWRI